MSLWWSWSPFSSRWSWWLWKKMISPWLWWRSRASSEAVLSKTQLGWGLIPCLGVYQHLKCANVISERNHTGRESKKFIRWLRNANPESVPSRKLWISFGLKNLNFHSTGNNFSLPLRKCFVLSLHFVQSIGKAMCWGGVALCARFNRWKSIVGLFILHEWVKGSHIVNALRTLCGQVFQ